jgi:hypothetical protein
MLYLAKNNRRALLYAIAAFICAIIIFLATHEFAFYKYVRTIFSLRDRGLYWQLSMDHIAENYNWLKGTGYLGFWPDNNRPHNGYLTQVIDFGIFGFLFFSSTIIYLFYLALHTGKAPGEKRATGPFAYDLPSQLLFFMLLGIMTAELFSDTLATSLFFTPLIFWFFLGTLPKLITLKESDNAA